MPSPGLLHWCHLVPLVGCYIEHVDIMGLSCGIEPACDNDGVPVCDGAGGCHSDGHVGTLAPGVLGWIIHLHGGCVGGLSGVPPHQVHLAQQGHAGCIMSRGRHGRALAPRSPLQAVDVTGGVRGDGSRLVEGAPAQDEAALDEGGGVAPSW